MADHLTLTPSGSSDGAMEGHGRAAKVATLSFSHSPNLATLEHMGLNLPYPASRYATGNRLALWYHRNDGPWTPPGLTSPQGDIRTSTMLRTNPLAFAAGQYRESIVPSECDTVAPGIIPSDSGYGSYGAKHSVANGSVCDESLDRNTETQSLVGHISELHFQPYGQDIMSKGGVNPEAPWSQPQQTPSSSSAINRQPNFEDRTCEACGKTLKTKSEFKKHKQRHDKPFKCNVKNCARREGFSTPNDLDRHTRSLHPEKAATGNRYRCLIGACKNKEKIWPRADNFRAHMKRVHQKEQMTDDDLDEYKFRPTAFPRDTRSIASDSAAPAPAPDRYDMFPVGSETWTLPRNPVIDLSTETSPMEGPSQDQIDENPLVDQPSDEGRLCISNNAPVHEAHSERDDVALNKQMGIPISPSTQPSLSVDEKTESAKSGQMKDRNANPHSGESDLKLAIEPNTREDNPDVLQGHPSEASLEVLLPNKQSENSTSIDKDIHALPKPLGLNGITGLDHAQLLKFLEMLQSNGVLGQLGYKKDDPTGNEAIKQDLTQALPPEQAHTCLKCDKKFNRRCELKKHAKRHLKPYGCTFSDCSKRFGSKNDWKRHENSQHYMSEHWRCDEKKVDDSVDACGKVFPRREFFEKHLSAYHHVEDQAILETKAEKCRVGRNFEVRFWCGFCQEIIEVKKSGIEAKTERFDHIDDHFQGRNNQEKRSIDDWKSEYPPDSRAESLANDSEDCSIISATPASSVGNSDIHGHPGLEKRHARNIRQKRKRDDGCDESAKRHEMEEMPRFHCCQCRETMPVTSKQCTNYPCEHRLCNECR